MQYLKIHPTVPGALRWQLGLVGKPIKGEHAWLVISTTGGTRIEIPIGKLVGDIECYSGRDIGQLAVALISEEQLQRDRAEAEALYRYQPANQGATP